MIVMGLDRISGVMVSMLHSSVVGRGRVQTKTGWLAIKIIRPSGATCCPRNVVSLSYHYKNIQQQSPIYNIFIKTT
jgi:hypothetical protein